MIHAYTYLVTRSRNESGQTAVEWMTIAAIFLIAVAIVFYMLGVNVRDAGCDVLESTLGAITDVDCTPAGGPG